MIRLLLLVGIFHIFGFVAAQNYVSLAPWDNALSYHPSIVGVHTDESFQMNIFSQKDFFNNIFGGGTTIRGFYDAIDFPEGLLEPYDIKNSYFLGYQKTTTLNGQHRITGGLQLQHLKEFNRQSQNVTSAGFTFNYHKPLTKKNYKTRYISFSYQINLLLHTPNLSVTPFVYNTISTPRITFDEFNDQFRNSGLSQSLSFNYSFLREKRTFFNIGATLSFYHLKAPRASARATSIDGIVLFQNQTHVQGRGYLHFQQALSKKITLDIKILAQTNSQFGLGFGFRVGKHSLLNLHYVRASFTSDPSINTSINSYSSAQVSLDMKHYKYIATIGIDTNLLKLGVVYRLEARDTQSMLSFNQ